MERGPRNGVFFLLIFFPLNACTLELSDQKPFTTKRAKKKKRDPLAGPPHDVAVRGHGPGAEKKRQRTKNRDQNPRSKPENLDENPRTERKTFDNRNETTLQSKNTFRRPTRLTGRGVGLVVGHLTETPTTPLLQAVSCRLWPSDCQLTFNCRLSLLTVDCPF